MALSDVVDLLACPVCARRAQHFDVSLRLAERALTCTRGHAFDVGRGGTVNLSGAAAPRHADTAAMVAARERFLDTDAYAPVADAVLAQVRTYADAVDAVLEPGAGPGWYLRRLLVGLSGVPGPRGVALDLSPTAVRRAAARAQNASCPVRLGGVVADVWSQVPLRSGCVDVVLSVFAPRHPAEFARVLRPDGILVVASALPDHLQTIRDRLGLLAVEPGKDERLNAALGKHLTLLRDQHVRFRPTISPAQLADLVAMGPNAFHRPAAGATPTAPVDLDVAVRVSVWRAHR